MRASLFSAAPGKRALAIEPLGPTAAVLALQSLGPGAALDAKLELTFEPSGEKRPWEAPVFIPGDSAEFFMPSASGEGSLELETLASDGVIARVIGTIHDVYGHEHRVDDAVRVGEWWKVVSEASQRYQESADKKAVRELEKIR